MKIKKYKVIVNYNDDKNILDKLKNINLVDLKIEQNEKNIIFFLRNKKEINKLDKIDVNYKIYNLYYINIINIIKNNIITIFGILFFLFMIFLLKITITDIEFTDKETYSKEIYDEVLSYLDDIYNYKFLTKDLSEINDNLKVKFYEYEWINLEKKGTKLYINISKSINDNLVSNNEFGSLYSKYDAYILGYYVANGKALITNNMTVSKDDELISGYVPIFNDKYNKVKAEGYVIGQIYETKSISVNKENIKISRSGKYKSKYKLIFGEPELESPFNNYDLKVNEIFSLFGFIKYVKLEYYELVENEVKYDKDSGNIYSKSVIDKEFNEDKKYGFEKIISINLLNTLETNDSYVYTYGIKMIKDICYFKKYD